MIISDSDAFSEFGFSFFFYSYDYHFPNLECIVTLAALFGLD